jgi:hypothetical protein
MADRKGVRSPANPKTATRPHAAGGHVPAQKPAGARKIAKPIAHFGKTAKKPENDDRPLKHGHTARRHKKRQLLEQQKI